MSVQIVYRFSSLKNPLQEFHLFVKYIWTDQCSWWLKKLSMLRWLLCKVSTDSLYLTFPERFSTALPKITYHCVKPASCCWVNTLPGSILILLGINTIWVAREFCCVYDHQCVLSFSNWESILQFLLFLQRKQLALFAVKVTCEMLTRKFWSSFFLGTKR